MRLLLDTNVLLFYQRDDDRLDRNTKKTIMDAQNDVFVSMASIWEVAIKHSLGKLAVKGGLDLWISDLQSTEDLFLLPIIETHIVQSAKLPFIHRDPFDRLIYAQSLVENMTLLSLDPVFEQYRKV